MNNKKRGYYVVTKTGFKGIVYSNDSTVNGKVKVRLPNNKNMLCDANSLTITGYFD